MKNVRIISLLLVLCLTLTLVHPISVKAAEENGMVINKTSTANGDGTYTIQLEAYATGSKIITETTKDKPTDIVLVLDESGSMAHCIECGEEMDGWYDTHNKYTKADQVIVGESYYIKNGTGYQQVYYCSGRHTSWTGSTSNCSGGAGWYTSDESRNHTGQNKINPTQVQFYEATEVACSPRSDALKDAAENFVNEVQKKAVGSDTTSTSDDVAHRIAVVGFASSASNLTSGFKDMTDSDDVDDVLNVIDDLSANGGTQVDDGIRIANQIFAANPIATGSDRQRVLIVFTDGAPGDYGDWGQGSVNTANAAISDANTAKNTHKATVYTVGIFSGANASSPDSLPAYTAYDMYGDVSEANQINNSNRFMHLVSSNYPNSTNITRPGAINPDLNGNSYYLSAGDAETLNSIFQQISNQIESGSTSSILTSESVVKDIIAPGFKLPAGASAANITLETYACTGKSNGKYTWTKNADAMGATATVNGDTVDVTGFDFSKNYVAEVTKNGVPTGSYQGHKLVITFTVQRKPEYLGGNGVETNASAGIYENANAKEPIVTFPKPVVNVPINQVVVANADDQNVYLYDTLTGGNLREDATVTVGGIKLDLTKPNYGLADWQTAGVDIAVAITDKGGNAVTDETFKNLTEDSEYNVSVTVSPKNKAEASKPERGPAATKQEGADSAQINVFKPVITFNDTAINLGDSANYEDNGGTINEWIHTVKNADGTETITKSTDTGVVMDTAVPTDITYSYSIPAAAFTEETEVKVTVSRGNSNVDLSEHVTFYRDACNFADCNHKEKTKVESTANRVNFVVHIDTFNLTISKMGANTTLDPSQTFIFYVTGPNNFAQTVVIEGNGSKTLVNLPVGKYTVREDTSWSWRYTPDEISKEVEPSGASATVTFKNTRDEVQWLDGNSYAKNSFAKLSAN